MQESHNATILVVDDEEIDREILIALLNSDGYNVLQTDNGVDALRLIETKSIDLVLLDLLMHPMDGLEVCARIKQGMGKVDLPIIIITSRDDRESRLQARTAGCDDFLAKPIDPSELSVRVVNTLRVKAYHDQRARQSELMEEELGRTREKLLQVDRLATLGTLVAGIGHELGNILSALSMTVELMRARSQSGQPAREMDYARLDNIVNHIKTHVTYLLHYGRSDSQVRSRLDMREIVRSTLDMMRVSGRLKGISLETELPELPVVAEVNRTQIEQVLVNLICNAVDAMAQLNDRTPKICITLAQTSFNHADFNVEDNGSGIPASNLGTIFDAYYTTKAAEQGTGLGLAVVKRIVESYGGTISVTSSEGIGTAMHFSVPVVVELAQSAEAPND